MVLLVIAWVITTDVTIYKLHISLRLLEERLFFTNSSLGNLYSVHKESTFIAIMKGYPFWT